MVKWIHQTGIWTKHFCETRNAECLWEVDQFSEWIQAFWSFLNQNWAFSQDTNIHHFHEFCTSCSDSVVSWPLKNSHVLYDEKDANFALPFCVVNIIVLKTNKFQSLSHDIVPFFDNFFSNIFPNPQIRLRKTKIKHLKSITFFPHSLKTFSTLLQSKNFLNNLNSFFSLHIQEF